MSGRKSITATVLGPNNKLMTKEVTYVSSSVRLYYNMQHKLILLNVLQTSFFLYLTEQMNRITNEVYIDTHLKEGYITFLIAVTKRKVPMSTVNKAVQKLASMDLIVLAAKASKTDYLVNPKYAVRGNEKKRHALLKTLIEE